MVATYSHRLGHQRLPVCCSVLQLLYTATHCNTLQHTATHCNTDQRLPLPRCLARCVAGVMTDPCCSVLQCVAVCCSVLQCVAVSHRLARCVAASRHGLSAHLCVCAHTNTRDTHACHEPRSLACVITPR